jgi:hypothetical protein
MYEAKNISTFKALEVSLEGQDGTIIPVIFKYDPDKAGEALVKIGESGNWLPVRLLKTAVDVFVDREPFAFEGQ